MKYKVGTSSIPTYNSLDVVRRGHTIVTQLFPHRISGSLRELLQRERQALNLRIQQDGSPYLHRAVLIRCDHGREGRIENRMYELHLLTKSYRLDSGEMQVGDFALLCYAEIGKPRAYLGRAGLL